MVHRHAAKILSLAAVVGFAYLPLAGAAVPADQDDKAADKTFDVWELRVLGNTVLGGPVIERCLYPYLGEHKTIENVEAARTALEKLYHDEGYATVFVDIPEQSVDGGIVRLHVTEGKLNRVAVTGTRYFSNRQIRAAIPEAHKDVVPHFPTLQAELAELNAKTADRSIVPILKSGPVSGTVDLTLRVDDRLPVHGSLEINNQYTADTTQLRALAALSYDNLFGRLNSLSLQYQTAPQETSEVGVWVASYVQRIGDARWAFYYVDSNSSVLLSQGGLGVLGTGQVYGTRLAIPLETNPGGSHSINIGLDYKDYSQAIGASDSTVKTPITYMQMSAGYNGFWRGENTQASLDTTFNFGIRGAGNDSVEFENKRYLGQPNYFYIRSAASIGRRLPKDFTLTWRLAGQYTLDPLIDNEQYAIAGADGVRGYLEAEEIADTGIKTAVQFGSPQWQIASGALITDAFVFYDYGRIGVVEPLPGEISHLAISSAGAGLNLSALKHLTGSVTWAYPLKDSSRTEAGDSFVLFNLRGYW